MVKYLSASLDVTFSALADPTRRTILARLVRGESSVTDLAKPFNISLPAISKHLRVLEGAGLLARERDGRVHRLRLVPEPLKEAAEWIAHYRHFWEGKFDNLADYLNDLNKKEEQSWSQKTTALKRPSTSNGPLRHRGRKSSGPGRTRKS